MANSKHSECFYPNFDKVATRVSKPLELRLREISHEGDEEPNVGRQLALEITIIATALYVKKDGLSHEQYAFLGDLYDHALGPDHEKMSAEKHTERFIKLADNEVFREPPISLLNLLRGYDAANNTKTAVAYRDLLCEIVSYTLSTVDSASDKDKEIIGQLETLWSEVLAAARMPSNRKDPNNSTPIIDEVNAAVAQFVGPIRKVVESMEELANIESLKDTEEFIRRSLTNYLAQAVLVDSVVHEKEVDLLYDLAPTLGIYGPLGDVQNLRDQFEKVTQQVPPDKIPLVVSILDIYDEWMETKLGEKARSLFLRLTNTVFEVDLDVDPEELQWLNQFKETLYPKGAPVPD